MMTPELRRKVVIVSVTIGLGVLSWASLFVIVPPPPPPPPPPSSPAVAPMTYEDCVAGWKLEREMIADLEKAVAADNIPGWREDASVRRAARELRNAEWRTLCQNALRSSSQ